MALPWSIVEKKPSYLALTPEEKLEAKEEYFNDVIIPKAIKKGIPQNELPLVRKEFFGEAEKEKKEPYEIGSKYVSDKGEFAEYAGKGKWVKHEPEYEKISEYVTPHNIGEVFKSLIPLHKPEFKPEYRTHFRGTKRTKKIIEDFKPSVPYTEFLKSKEGVEDVEFGGAWLKKLDQAISTFLIGDIIFGIFIAIAVIMIVSNFMRVVVLSQAETIRIMSLMGASKADISFPLLVQGMLLGGAGASVGILFLWSGYLIFQSQILSLTFLPFHMIFGLIGWGMILGAGGSSVSLRKHLEIQN